MGLAQERMKHKPTWRHLRDVHDWKQLRDDNSNIDAQHCPGVGWPHHFRLSLDRVGNAVVEVKQWLTDPNWSDPQILMHADDVRALRHLDPPLVNPNWDANRNDGKTPKTSYEEIF